MFQSLQKKTVALVGATIATTSGATNAQAISPTTTNGPSRSTTTHDDMKFSELRSPNGTSLIRILKKEVNTISDLEAFLKVLQEGNRRLDAKADELSMALDIIPEAVRLKEEKLAGLNSERRALEKTNKENTWTIKKLLKRRSDADKWIEKKKEDLKALAKERDEAARNREERVKEKERVERLEQERREREEKERKKEEEYRKNNKREPAASRDRDNRRNQRRSTSSGSDTSKSEHGD